MSIDVSILVGVSRIVLTCVSFWVMFNLWMKAALAVLVTTRQGVDFFVLSGFIILIPKTTSDAKFYKYLLSLSNFLFHRGEFTVVIHNMY